MTDSPLITGKQQAKPGKGNGAGSKLTQLKPGYDPRRWLKGRPRVPKDKAAAGKIIEQVIWDILSEEITNPATGEKVDRLRAMVRSMSTNKAMQDKLLDRIAGKVAQSVEIGGEAGSVKIEVIYVKPTDQTS